MRFSSIPLKHLFLALGVFVLVDVRPVAAGDPLGSVIIILDEIPGGSMQKGATDAKGEVTFATSGPAHTG